MPERLINITLTADDRPDGPVCDFCSGPDIVWRYPCASFDLPDFDSGSEGDWAACAPCSAIIETVPQPIGGNPVSGERMADLAKRAIDRVYPDGPPSAEDLMAIGVYLFSLHSGFFNNRTGPRTSDTAVGPGDRP